MAPSGWGLLNQSRFRSARKAWGRSFQLWGVGEIWKHIISCILMVCYAFICACLASTYDEDVFIYGKENTSLLGDKSTNSSDVKQCRNARSQAFCIAFKYLWYPCWLNTHTSVGTITPPLTSINWNVFACVVSARFLLRLETFCTLHITLIWVVWEFNNKVVMKWK